MSNLEQPMSVHRMVQQTAGMAFPSVWLGSPKARRSGIRPIIAIETRISQLATINIDNPAAHEV